MARVGREVAQQRRLLAAASSVAVGHLALLLALLSVQVIPPPPSDLAPITVELVELRRPPPPAVAKPSAPPQPAAARPPPPRNIARRAPAPPDIEPLPAGEGPSADGPPGLTEAQLAGAATAGSGPAGGACDMTRRLQSALRGDRQVQAAVADAHLGQGSGSGAIMVWNGDWVRHPGQEGNGLAAVREAIMWEVAFAPEACRAEPVHGLILISLNDGPQASRLVVGSDAWRWSDLLRLRSGAPAASRR